MTLAVKRRKYLTPDDNQYKKKLEIRYATLEYCKYKAFICAYVFTRPQKVSNGQYTN